jgi:hypothetical protein
MLCTVGADADADGLWQYINEIRCKNARWARYARLDVHDVGCAERDFLGVLEYKCGVSEAELSLIVASMNEERVRSQLNGRSHHSSVAQPKSAADETQVTPNSITSSSVKVCFFLSLCPGKLLMVHRTAISRPPSLRPHRS